MRLRPSFQHDQLAPESRVLGFAAREALSEPFEVRVDVVDPDPDLDLSALLDTTGLLTLADEDSADEPLRFHGVVEQAEALEPLDVARTGAVYRLRLRPRLAGLAYRIRSRLFQDRTAVEVAREVLKGAGLADADVDWRVRREYPKRDLCVQYRESELDFVLRLLEDEGIFFWFEHSDGGHVLALGDGPDAHRPIEGERRLRYEPWSVRGADVVSELVYSAEIAPDVHLSRDWNWRTPAEAVEAEERRGDAKGRRWYEYPGGFADAADGRRRARDRLRADGTVEALAGLSTCLRMAPGRTFEVDGASPPALDRDWLLVEVEHVLETLGAGDLAHAARFRAIPGDAEFRPRRRTPRPRAHGKELAVVTGPAGEDVHVDPMARVKVHLLWDREGATDDTSSAWIRVQQLNTSGAMILPRVGWEVDVGFLDGDPDRPVVLQRLYNRDGMPPHGLPDGKTKSSLQSHSTGGAGGVNALTLEDGSGAMEMALVASKDLAIAVGHDATERIGTDASEEVGQNLQERVGGAEEVVVGAAQSTSVGGSCTLETVGSKRVAIGGPDQIGVTGNRAFTCDGSRTEQIGAVANVLASQVVETVNGSSTRTISAALSLNAVKALVEVVGGSKRETVGGARLEILRGAHSESISGNRVLTAAAVVEKAGEDVAVTAGGSMAVTVGGPMAVKAAEAFSLGGDSLKVVTGTASMKVNGTSLDAGGTLKVDASSLVGAGKATLKLKGKIDFTD